MKGLSRLRIVDDGLPPSSGSVRTSVNALVGAAAATRRTVSTVVCLRRVQDSSCRRPRRVACVHVHDELIMNAIVALTRISTQTARQPRHSICVTLPTDLPAAASDNLGVVSTMLDVQPYLQASDTGAICRNRHQGSPIGALYWL